MSIFKIKLRPIIKENEWKVSYVKSSQKEKVCAYCEIKLPVGSSSTTFMKRTKIGGKTKFVTHHTCGHKKSLCTHVIAEKLQIRLP